MNIVENKEENNLPHRRKTDRIPKIDPAYF
jgi:hypothetical protein